MDAEAEHLAKAGVEWTPPVDRASAEELGPLRLQKTARLKLEPMTQVENICMNVYCVRVYSEILI